MNPIKLIECSRDAMQGWKTLIPTVSKIEYINSLLKVGFDTIDFGSFVSSKAIPQMADTKEVIPHLDLSSSSSKLLAIIANVRGAEDAASFDEISYLGFPFSISPTFQIRNANSSIEESLERVLHIRNICEKNKKTLVIYISMGFGNPYGDEYNEDIVLEWVSKLVVNDIKIVSIADTVGLAKPEQITSVLNKLMPAHSDIEIGVHLHSNPSGQNKKIEAALNAGCKRFDGALKGIGGCPMANDDLVGNMNTEMMIDYLESKNIPVNINKEALQLSLSLANRIFQ